MVAHTPQLVKGAMEVLDACGRRDVEGFRGGLSQFLEAMKKINGVMDTMWGRSSPEDYINFRTFIMGTKAQPMFPKGVIYEGVSSEPQFFRGESGANDSIIPTADNLCELTSRMPSNPLTEILRDFRTYRPAHHNQWLSFCETRAKQVGVRAFAEKDPASAVMYLSILDQIRDFRARHWNFTKEYIIKHTSHPVATGGSPIVSWLPNQLATVLDYMAEVGTALQSNADNIKALSDAERKVLEGCMDRAHVQRKVLAREVQMLKERFKPEAVEARL
ncbi:hypothetical protein HK102_009609 [Quaeritorhiza haematococci]|nr:hypothetical protein HK102_009609 [Quaeritorhiza haematococci]